MSGQPTNDASEIFMVKARRCKRCGGLLTSAQAVRDGYGHVCKMKELGEQEAKKPFPGQMFLLGMEEETEE
jgi:hypothetical protein